MPARDALTQGTRIADRFVIEHPVAEGGMGLVYHASDTHTGQPVALKLLPRTSAQRHAQALREAEILSRLQSRNIVRYVAHGSMPSGDLYVVTEWLEGEDLGQALQRQPLTLAATLRILTQVSDALAEVHAHGLLHGDVKPSNIFLCSGPDSRVVLLDFGITRPFSADTSAYDQTEPSIVGTVNYLAPEQARGEQTIGPQADLFALGCVLQECLTGKPPFSAGSSSGVLARILFEEPPALSGNEIAISAPVQQLLFSLLAKRPEARPDSAVAVRAQLEQLAKQSGSDSPRGPVEHTQDTLTVGEQRLVTLIVAREQATPSKRRSSSEMAAPDVSALRSLFAPFAARIESLADGTVVVMLSQLSSNEATDQAEQAVRSALLLMSSWPTGHVVVTTGRERVLPRLQMGEAVDRAVQLLSEADGLRRAPHGTGRGLLLDETTARLVDVVFDVTPLSATCFVIFPEQPRLDRTRLLLGKPTPCVGREHDLSVLETTLSHCLNEPLARLVLVSAPPGHGKSRLRQEFLNRVTQRPQPIQILFGRGDLMGVGSPFSLISSALRRLCGMEERDEAEVQRRKLADHVHRRVAADQAVRVTAFLGELCGLPFPVEYCPLLPGAYLNPRTMNSQVTQAWTDFLAAELALDPLILVLEDIQWGDALSIGLIQTALRELAGQRLLVLALGRPEFEELFPGICQDRGSFLLRLGRLGRRACTRLVRHALGDAYEPTLVNRIVDQADGSPLYLEELIRAVSTMQAGAHTETVLAMLQARLMRLPMGERRLLRAGSVFGQSFDLDALAGLLGHQLSTETVEAWLSALIEAELIEPSTDRIDGGRFRFRHALIQEAAYDLLTEQDRTLGHRLAAQYLQRQGGREPRLLAEHFRRGGLPVEASHHYLAASERALASSDLAGALDCAQQGLDCSPPVDVDGALRVVQVQAHFWRDEWSQALECGQEALQRVSLGSEHWCRAAAVLLPTTFLRRHGEMFAEIGRALPTFQPTASARPDYMQAASYLVISTCLMGDRTTAQALLALCRMHVDATGHDADTIEHGLLMFAELVEARSFTCDPTTALRLADAATRITTKAGDLRTLLFVMAYLGAALLELGSIDAAKPIFDDCLQLAERQNEPLLATHVRVQYERWLLATEQPDLLAHAVASARRTIDNPATNPLLQGEAFANFAAGMLRLGDLDAAEQAAKQACAALSGVPSEHLWALAVLLDVLRLQGRYAAAQPWLEAGQRALAQCGGSYSETTFLAAAAELCTAAGAEQQARDLTSQAMRTLMRAAAHIEQPSLLDSYLHGVSANVRIQRLARLWQS